MPNNLNTNPNKLGPNARIVQYFLKQKQLTAMLLAIIVIVGAGSFFQLHVQGFPEIQVPIAVVSTTVPGAGPETVNDTVTVPIENALRDLKGVKQITSTSQSNVSSVILSFDSGVDVNLAIQDARTKLASVKLPEGINDPNIFVPETGVAPFFVAVSGPKSLLDLKTQADTIKQKLLAIKGVKSFTDVSGVDEKIYIDLPPQYNYPQVIAQLTAANIGFPLGQSTIEGKNVPVSGETSLKSLEDVRNIPVNLPPIADQPSRTVKLADIASVYTSLSVGNDVHRVGYLDSAENKFKIQPALLYEVQLESDADLLSVGKEVEKVVADTKAPDGKSDYALVFNQAKDAQRQVNEILNSAFGSKWSNAGAVGYLGYIFGGIWLLIIGMLLFLDWRSALISALSIPLAFLFTFIILALLGIQMNTLVLFSFILVLGLIVDPAIVVLESIKRYMEIGYKGQAAVFRSIDVIGLGLFIAVLTSLIVFIPFSVVSGIFGQIIKYIPLTVFPALIASYFIPLIFLTWLAAKFLKAKPTQALHDEDDVHTLWPVAQWLIRANRFVLSRVWLQIVVIVLGLAVPIGISAVLFATNKVRQVQFATPDDVEFIQLSIPKPANQTDSQLQVEVATIENVLKNHLKDIDIFFYRDFGGPDGSGGGQSISVSVTLKPLADRDTKSPEIAQAIQQELQDKFGKEALASQSGAGPPQDSYPVTVKIFENDPAKLATATQKVKDELKSYSEVADVIADNDTTSKELVVAVDPDKAASAGVTAAQVYGQIAGFLGEKTLYRVGETDVVLRTPDDSKPNTIEALNALQIYGIPSGAGGANGSATPGAVVRVSDVATIQESAVPASIRRAQGDRYAQVSARLNDARDAINVQRRISDWAKAHTGDLGVNDRAFEDRVGVNEFEKSFQELFLAIALAILLTYIVFVVFFKSFLQPLIILFAVPLILIGVFPALALLAGGQFGFLEIIGILMVVGIAENVGIFLIDYANRKVAQGMNKKEAIAIASGIRFRPVILTKITALAGLLPLAVFSPFWRGLSTVVIFGILSSGILSLFTTPVLYNWLTRKRKIDVADDQTPLEPVFVDPYQQPLAIPSEEFFNPEMDLPNDYPV